MVTCTHRKWAWAHFFVWVGSQRDSLTRHVRESQQVADAVRAIATPIVRSLQLELVDVECAGHGARTMLRVFIDKPGGVSVGECEQVHQSLGHALDLENLIPHAYTLEVSSPGLDRPLRRIEDYRRALGKQVSVKLGLPWQGQWRVVGRLLDVSEAGVTLSLTRVAPGQTLQLEWGGIAEARLEVEF